MTMKQQKSLLLLVAFHTLALISALQLKVTEIDDGVKPPDTMKPTGYPYCIDVVKNGKFEEGDLLHWLGKSAEHCEVKKNWGETAVPVGPFNIMVMLPPLADSFDALAIPQQGYQLNQTCGLEQDIAFKAHAQILYAQLSWVDRITTQTNYYDEDQFARVGINVMDNNPDTPDIPVPVFVTTDDNTDSESVKRKLRVTDVTHMLQGMKDENDMVRLELSLDEQAFDGPVYFQWDNVELWVCFPEQPADPRAEGDPHFTTWGGVRYTYNGVCDLVLLHSEKFADNLGLDIHIRTRRRHSFSFISHAAFKIGEDTFEIVGNNEEYYINGVNKPGLPATIAGFEITRKQIDNVRFVYTIDLGKGQSIIIRTYKDILMLKIHHADETDFGDSVGLMGDFFTGEWLARDGVTVHTDPDAFGAEWQVGNNGEGETEEVSMFQMFSMPQYPQECLVPNANIKDSGMIWRRRLGETKVTAEAAEEACKEIDDKSDHEFCVYDVIAANDVGIAMAYL